MTTYSFLFVLEIDLDAVCDILIFKETDYGQQIVSLRD